MTDGWYLLRGDIQYGPFTFAQLLECVSTNKITRADLVRRDGTTEWQPAGRFPELYFSVPPANACDRLTATYALFSSRFVAKLIDDFGYFFANAMVVAGVRIAISAPSDTAFQQNLNLGILLTGNWLYSAFLVSSRYQATLGKLCLGVRVTDEAGNRISFGRASARYFAEYLSIVCFLLGYVAALMTDKKQTLHDLIAKTLVLNKPTEY